MISATVTAAMAGNPTAMSRGAATAAGVPNPAAPSMKAPNIQAMIMAWMRRSGVISMNPLRMVATAPLFVRVFNMSSAPKTIQRMAAQMVTPWTMEAAMTTPETFQ